MRFAFLLRRVGNTAVEEQTLNGQPGAQAQVIRVPLNIVVDVVGDGQLQGGNREPPQQPGKSVEGDHARNGTKGNDRWRWYLAESPLKTTIMEHHAETPSRKCVP